MEHLSRPQQPPSGPRPGEIDKSAADTVDSPFRGHLEVPRRVAGHGSLLLDVMGIFMDRCHVRIGGHINGRPRQERVQADHGVAPSANRCCRIPYSIWGPTTPLMSGADGRESRPIVPGRFGRSLFVGAQTLPAQRPNLDRVRVWKPGAGKISVAADHQQLAESWRLIAIAGVTAQDARVCVPPDRLARQRLISPWTWLVLRRASWP